MYVCMYVRTQIERRSLSKLGWVGAPTSAQVNTTSALSRPEPVPSQPLLVLQVSPASAQVSNKSAPGQPVLGLTWVDLPQVSPESAPSLSKSAYVHTSVASPKSAQLNPRQYLSLVVLGTSAQVGPKSARS